MIFIKLALFLKIKPTEMIVTFIKISNTGFLALQWTSLQNHYFKLAYFTCHHLIRVIIGSAVLTKALPADCLRFQRVDPLSIYNIYIFFCKMSTFLEVFLPNCC